MNGVDRAPALTAVNEIWWMIISPQAVAFALGCNRYLNNEGYLKARRNGDHLSFHDLAVPDSEKFGVESPCAALRMVMERDLVGKSRDYCHRACESYLFHLKSSGLPADEELFDWMTNLLRLVCQVIHDPWYASAGSDLYSLNDLMFIRRHFVAKFQELPREMRWVWIRSGLYL